MNHRYFALAFVLLLILSACSHLKPGPDKSPISKDSNASIEMDMAAGSTHPNLSDPSLDSDAASSGDRNENEPTAESMAIQKVQSDLDEALELCQLSQEYWQQGELENAVDHDVA